MVKSPGRHRGVREIWREASLKTLIRWWWWWWWWWWWLLPLCWCSSYEWQQLWWPGVSAWYRRHRPEKELRQWWRLQVDLNLPPLAPFKLIICSDSILFDQGSTNERGGWACLLSGHWATSCYQVKPRAIRWTQVAGESRWTTLMGAFYYLNIWKTVPSIGKYVGNTFWPRR